MMTSRQGNIFTAGLLLFFVSTMLILGFVHWGYTTKVMGFPALVGTLAMLCAGWLVVRSWTVNFDELEKECQPFAQGNHRCSLARRTLWLSSIFPLGYFFGFVIGLIAFTLCYTSYHGLPWWQRLVTSAVVFAFVYVGFYKLLGVPLPIDPVWLRG